MTTRANARNKQTKGFMEKRSGGPLTFGKLLTALVCVLLAACTPTQPPSPEQLQFWMYGRFGPELLSTIETGSIRFEGGDGSSFSTAIRIVGAPTGKEGVTSEYYYLCLEYGRQGVEWGPVTQSLVPHGGREYDVLEIQLAGEWTTRTYYFDITEFRHKDRELIEKWLEDREDDER